MTEGDGVVTRAIRVRLDGTASQSDIGALKKWLEREKPLEELVRSGELRIQESAGSDEQGTDEQGTPMGAAIEILMLLSGAAAQSMFDTVFKQVGRGVKAWYENRRSVESGDPPDYDVDPVHLDER
ncbi:hypothetical protein [Streptomyces sp. 142MFCol3.1]|uniref:hypothetical protein n=1 Tax=Streptomyces sp. 142MFCol3.1 TaxID=1172179 RepID=UPI00048F1F39|nr:hypothetical protein [Streptomyces sp. 142MFCol3.1]